MTLRNPAYMGVSYPDRWKMAVAVNAQLNVYVPKPGSRTGLLLAPRSGIVGLPYDTADKVMIYFEGWVNGAAQYENLDAFGKWEAGVEHAAGRMLTEYPTIAMRVVDEDELKLVGYYHCSNADGERIRLFDEEEVRAWLS